MSVDKRTFAATLQANAGTEIVVTDGKRAKLAAGAGTLRIELPPGVYKARFKAGGRFEDRLFEMAGEDVVVQGPRLKIDSPAPLGNSGNTHEYHEAIARGIKDLPALKCGDGCELAILVRDSLKLPNRGASGAPWTGLTLQDMNGRVQADLSIDGLRDSNLGFGAIRVEVDPGTYLLTQRSDGGTTVQMPIVAIPQWRSTLFADCTRSGEPRVADLYGASIIMCRPFESFQPTDENLWLAELAKQSLAMGRASVDAAGMSGLLHEKFDNPLLGILAAHVLLLEKKPRIPLIATVVGNMERLLPGHPDLFALRAWLAGHGACEFPTLPMRSPPMLRASWDILLDASFDHPRLLPPNAEWVGFAAGLSSSAVWFAWRREDTDFPPVLTTPSFTADDPLPTLDGRIDLAALAAYWGPYRNALTDPRIAANPLQHTLRRKLVSLIDDDFGQDNRAPTMRDLARDLRVPIPTVEVAAFALRAAARRLSPPSGSPTGAKSGGMRQTGSG